MVTREHRGKENAQFVPSAHGSHREGEVDDRLFPDDRGPP